MPRSVFDVKQYELRGTLPKVYSSTQKETLDRVLNRVQGQLDWTAQLLGFNGPNYWGTKLPAQGGEYKWKGLPETASEKRALQSASFGVYNKDKSYSSWPIPFNRSDIGASGDQAFAVSESGGTTTLSVPLQGELISFKKNPFVFAGGEYYFDALLEVEPLSGDPSSLLVVSDINTETTTIRVVDDGISAFSVKKTGSSSSPFILFVREWEDISDWTQEDVLRAFLGLWGSKGNELSLHASFDALNLHGFNENKSLTLDAISKTIPVDQLLALLGLVPGPATPYTGENYNFHVEGCESEFTVVDLADSEVGECSTGNYTLGIGLEYDSDANGIATDPGPGTSVPIGCNGLLGAFPPACAIDNGTLEDGFSPEYLVNNGDYNGVSPAPDNIASNGIYDNNFNPLFLCDEQTDPDRVIDFDDLIIDVGGEPGPILMTDPATNDEIVLIASGGDYDGDVIGFDGPEISGFEFTYEAKNLSGAVIFPCVEWSFDYTLNNGTYFPINDQAPWMGTDDGVYDRDPRDVGSGGFQAEDHCTGGNFINGLLSFDDGEYDEVVEPNCNLPDDTLCSPIDGGIYKYGVNPLFLPEVNTNCLYECGTIDGEDYIYGEIPLIGAPILDGNGTAYLPSADCIIYDNKGYDRAPDFLTECVLDNGGDGSPLPSSTEDDGFYDNTPTSCVECTLVPNPPVIPCPVPPLRVRLDRLIFSNPTWRMQANVLNSLSPLRVWKNRPLTVAEFSEERTNFNYLLADHNRGPEDPESYRHFIRLPVEYSRATKEWTRAEATASNLSYFSRPAAISETRVDPEELRPLVYAEDYILSQEGLVSDPVYYDEDFLVSLVRTDDSDQESGFVGAKLSFEEADKFSPYIESKLTDYDALSWRRPLSDGSWSGSYYKVVRSGRLSGYLETDIKDLLLREVTPGEDPVYDRSIFRTPNIEFPDENDRASLSNYVVCYAYFTADLSAADEPVFDPTTLFCHRDAALDNTELSGYELETNPYGTTLVTENEDILETDPLENIYLSPIPTRTSYLLHQL
jgi:hypothetical protein